MTHPATAADGRAPSSWRCDLGVTATQVAIAWVLAQPSRPVALGGFRDVAGLRDAWAAASIELTIEQCHWLETGDTLD